MTPEEKATECWINKLVVSENLCPFAAGPMLMGKVRLHATEANTVDAVYKDLLAELLRYIETQEAELPTGLLIVPNALHDFAEYNDFLELVDQALEDTQAEGMIQIAGFHPDWVFADAPEDDPANYSNRSPYPMFHFIREDMLEQMLSNYPDPDAIPERNIKHLRELGSAELIALLDRCQHQKSDA